MQFGQVSTLSEERMRSPQPNRLAVRRSATQQFPARRGLLVLVLAGLLLLPMGLLAPGSGGRWLAPVAPQTAIAQFADLPGVAAMLYQQLPDLPQANTYTSRETGNVDANSTLLSRFIRYHMTIKGRSPGFRLDWKLTLADYLGVNEPISATNYPGAMTLTSNPMGEDVAAIQQLNRAQREQLVSTLVGLFNPATNTPPATSAPTPAPASTAPANRPGMGSTTPLPSEPRPGDAQLLLP